MSEKLTTELSARGLINQFSSDNLEEILDSKTKRTAYLGIDPTADSLHVGNLLPLMCLERFQRAGHSAMLLVGGATGLIGDPSGKDTEREFSDLKTVAGRTKLIARQLGSIAGLSKMPVVNNLDWYKRMGAIEYLREVGKHFTVNTMMKRESVARRIEGEHGISYTEFSYALLQGYDFYVLHKKYGVDLQIGGSDQWGNIISGVDFIRRKTGNTVYGVTIPLVVDKGTGKKFGKSEGNAIWLDARKTTYYDFYQFWLTTDDTNVIDYLKFFTFIPLPQIEALALALKENPAAREAHKALAFEVTKFVHGEGIAKDVKYVSELMFGETEISDLSRTDQSLVEKYATTVPVAGETDLVELLANNDLAGSKREAREFIKNKAIKINGKTVVDAEGAPIMINPKDYDAKLIVVNRGKQKKLILRFSKR